MNDYDKVISFRYVPVNAVLEVGKHYFVNGSYCRFIKVTRKGFNFLDVVEAECILKQHIYDKRFYGVPLPKNHTVVKTWLPGWLYVKPVEKRRYA